MSEIVPDVRTRAVVSLHGGTFRIDTVSAHAAYGAEGTVPDIDSVSLLDSPSQVNGVTGAEGELVIALQNGSDVWLNNRGELVLSVQETDNANRYSVDATEGDLIYTQGDQTTPEDNVLTEDGEALIIMVNALIRGKLDINSFSDVLTGDGTFEREFRINIESLFFTDWQPLTEEALAAIQYESNSVFSIQIRYVKTGGESVVFNSLTMTGTWEAGRFEAPTLMSSLFASLVGSPELKGIDDNIFKKLYFRGVVPRYITRAENVSYDEDRDYVMLFSTISYFFSLMIAFFKRFENFRNDEELLREQVRGFGIQFNEGSVTLEELQYLAANYYSQIQQRGTDMITVRKGDTLPNGRIADIDGELVRLLHSNRYNELLIGTIADYKMGWCIRQASPMYRGTCQEVTLNKTPENTQDFQSLSNFPIAVSGSGAASIVSSDEKRVMRLAISNLGTAGIGRLVGSATDQSAYLIAADPEISYEVTFAFRLVSGTKSDIEIYFGVEGFNDNGEKLDDAFVNLDGEVSDGRILYQNFSIWRQGIWYFARGVLNSYNTSLIAGTKTNLGVGVDLAFNNPFVRLILPRILVSSTSAAVVDLWDYKVRPLVRGKSVLPYKSGAPANSHSLGFIQARDFMYTYARNNNSLSQGEITDIIERYLYPYGKTDIFIFSGEIK